MTPIELRDQMHHLIISGEFRAWRRRRPTPNADRRPPNLARCDNDGAWKRCQHPDGCDEFYMDAPHRKYKLCRRHARSAASAESRARRMIRCAADGCERMVHVNAARSGKCQQHAQPATHRKRTTSEADA